MPEGSSKIARFGKMKKQANADFRCCASGLDFGDLWSSVMAQETVDSLVNKASDAYKKEQYERSAQLYSTAINKEREA